VAASEHAAGGDTGAGDVRVVARHGIWTVSAAGTFLGDYLDEEPPLRRRLRRAAADGGAADPWQRLEEDVRT
jgi:hypothetical protein